MAKLINVERKIVNTYQYKNIDELENHKEEMKKDGWKLENGCGYYHLENGIIEVRAKFYKKQSNKN